MYKYQTLHPRANVDRLHVSRKGDEGLLSTEECVNIEIKAQRQYLKNRENEWLKCAWEEGLIKEDEDSNIYKEKTTEQEKSKSRDPCMDNS